MKEEWKTIKEFENYQISSKGRIRKKVKYLKRVNDGRYLKVVLCKPGQMKQVYIHDLVAKAFIGEKPNGLVVHHKDGNSFNNIRENLQYATIGENVQFTILGGRSNHGGEHNGNSKLKIEQINQIRSLKGLMSTREIAQNFGIGKTTAYNIVHGLTWKNLHVWRDRARLPEVKQL